MALLLHSIRTGIHFNFTTLRRPAFNFHLPMTSEFIVSCNEIYVNYSTKNMSFTMPFSIYAMETGLLLILTKKMWGTTSVRLSKRYMQACGWILVGGNL